MAKAKPFRAFPLSAVLVAGQTGAVLDQSGPTREKKLVQHAELQFWKKSRLPKGLVGSQCTAKVNVAGQMCSCLLDTGS